MFYYYCNLEITILIIADPYSSWQKGAIENVNGLIRQYISKNTCFSNISHQQKTKIIHKIIYFVWFSFSDTKR